MNRFLPAWFRRAALRPVAGMLMVAQANVVAQELPAPSVLDARQIVHERPLEQAVRSALPATKQADTGTATGAQERETALSGHRYGAFAREFSEARVPYCLHHDGLKRQPTMIGPLPVSGYLALPFIFVARARGKCLF